MRRNRFPARRRQVIAMGAGAAVTTAAPSIVMAAHDSYTIQSGDKLVVSGRIPGAPGGQPLAGAQVEIWQANARGVRHEATREVAVTDGDGRYFVPMHATNANRLQYRVSHPDYAVQVTQLHTTGARQRSVTLTRDHTGATRAAFEMTLMPRGVVASATPDYVAL